MRDFHKKEGPFQGITGWGGGATGLRMAGGAALKTYIDDVFSTYLYKGTSAARSITNGIDLSTEGGLTWIKNRTTTGDNWLFDTARGATHYVKSNLSATAGNDAGLLSAFNSDGFSLGNDGSTNDVSSSFSSWSFRKAPGFFDIVTYTGTGSVINLSHSLGCVPGCVMIKKTSGSDNWSVYHRGVDSENPEYWWLGLNITNGRLATGGTTWNNTKPTSTHVTIGTGDQNVNTNGATYVAYVFAGGASTAATAKSVDFDGSNDYLSISDHDDFDIGTNWTAECWFKCDSLHSGGWTAMFGQNVDWVLEYVGTDLRFYYPSTYKSLGAVPLGQWHHVAISKQGSTTRIFLNGTQVVSDFDMGTVSSSQSLTIGGMIGGGGYFDGNISNVRIVQGTAVYTSSFKPPTEPLTNITNTKLLCCNDSSTTGSTVTPGSITNNGATASTDSPFDDPEGFKFGEEGDQGIIKTGSYKGNSTANHEIYMGWEPQYWLVKNVTDAQNWQLLDSMRGWVSDGNDEYLVPNNTSAESAFNFGNPTPTGFNLSNASSNWQNESGKTYIYMAIRSSDGYVGKPPELGTDVFAMDTGNGSSTIPAYDSGFIVDMAFHREPASTSNWLLSNRITGNHYLVPNLTNAESDVADFVFDSNTGWVKGYSSSYQSWMWKRHAGFDVQAYNGVSGTATRPHSMGVTPEMIWVKRRNASELWCVGHKDLNGGTNPWEHYIRIATNAEYSNNQFYQAPTSTHWSTNSGGLTNNNGDQYIAMLFASVEGISKVGSYTGSASEQTITLGFQPRFIIIKGITGSRNWLVLDTTRGWGSGNDSYIYLNSSAAQGTDHNFGAPTSNGFTVTGDSSQSGGSGSGRFIYYAHA